MTYPNTTTTLSTPQLRSLAPVANGQTPDVPLPSALDEMGVFPIDWAQFWTKEPAGEDWLAEPLIPRGRQVALYSAAKQGKSLLALEVAAALASGKAVLGREAGEPERVVYFDLEMTEDDLKERLCDFGYGPTDDLSRLAYYQLPQLPDLNTRPGKVAIEKILDKNPGTSLVVVDTTARVISGEENDSTPYRQLYQNTGLLLKQRGVSLLRLDHAGKDADRGQRGSSAKNDDVDVVWKLSATGENVTLTCTHRRVAWVPDEIRLVRGGDVLTHRWEQGCEKPLPAGAVEVAKLLSDLGVPINASVRDARSALSKVGQSKRTEVVGAALRYRRRESTE